MWSLEEVEDYFRNISIECPQHVVDGFSNFLSTHHEILGTEIEDTLDFYGDAFDVDREELSWCIAQVQSRAFSTTRFDMGAALHPVVDLLNHSDNAAFPLG